MSHTIKKYLFLIFLSVLAILNTQAFAASEGEFDAKEFALHHIADANEWHIVGNFVIPLPVIVYHPEKGLDVFMSNKLPEVHHEEISAEHDTIHSSIGNNHQTLSDDHTNHHEADSYHGYVMNHGRVTTIDGSKFYDLSITKNVATLLIVAILLIL
ncbi:MAG: hypothetical protein H7Y00_09385, partial [Fimbriimonadaceae bacterium]|nr:hypothetical protein [Chitinophagales bacterium]